MSRIEELKSRLKGGSENKRSVSRAAVLIIIGAIVVLFLAGNMDFGQKEKPAEQSGGVSTELEYVSRMETELTEILSRISGAGQVSVRIYVDSTNEKVLAEDSKKPVSYTHLDVYKRQVPPNIKDVGSQLRLLAELMGFIYFDRIGTNVTVQVVGGGFPDAPRCTNRFHSCNQIFIYTQTRLL